MSGRRRNDEGIIDEILDGLFEISRRSPVAGLAIGGLFAFAGVYFKWIAPKSLFGLGPLFGILCLVLAVIFGAVGVIGIVRQKLGLRQRPARLDMLIARDDKAPTREDLSAMDWREFEQLVADVYRRQGYRVDEVGGTGDGGVDLVLITSDGKEFLVQCKQYRVWDVGEPKVREFFGAMAAHKVRCEGIIVTCGRFTEPARQFAYGKPIRLIDGEALRQMIRSTNPLTPAVEHYTLGATASKAPACPACGAVMVRRTAKRGRGAGQDFWGCSSYPRCNYTRPL
jgi:restriction system protein